MGFQGFPHFGKFDEDDVAELFLGEIGDADDGLSAFNFDRS